MTETDSVMSVSSSVEAGNKLVISAGQDFNATGAKLNSDGTLLATAGRDINLDAAEDYASQANASSKKGMVLQQVQQLGSHADPLEQY
ncbi:hemagglutinin repeat-containing protein [Pseudomonas lini]